FRTNQPGQFVLILRDLPRDSKQQLSSLVVCQSCDGTSTFLRTRYRCVYMAVVSMRDHPDQAAIVRKLYFVMFSSVNPLTTDKQPIFLRGHDGFGCMTHGHIFNFALREGYRNEC